MTYCCFCVILCPRECKEAIIEEQRTNYNKTEYILAVLSMSDGQLDIGSIVEGGESEIASF